MNGHSLILKRRDYSLYHLLRNPFPYTPIPSNRPEIFVNQEKAISQLIDVVSTTYITGLSCHAVVIGPYGSGKSHTLKYIKKIIDESLKNTENKWCIVCYIPSPGSKFIDIYKEFVESVKINRLKRIAETVSLSFLPHNLTRALQSLNSDETKPLAWRWILGETLEAKKRGRLGVSGNLDNELALSNMKHIIQLLRKEESGFVCLLIDELETINELYTYQKQSLFNALRHMIDDNPEGLCTIFACTPAGWDEILNNSMALSRRLSRNLIYLSRLNKKEVTNIIKKYLQTSRIKLAMPKTEDTHLGLFPFTQDALEEIYQLSMGNVGELVKYCNLALDKGLDEGLPQIDSESLSRILSEFSG